MSLQAHNQRQGIQLDIVKGKYSIQPKEYYTHIEPIDFTNKSAVWIAEEKQTDVAIAVHLLCDVMDDDCDQVVIVSNDSDLTPAIAATKQRKPSTTVGIIAPVRGQGRLPSSDLKTYSDWTRNSIKEIELAAAQLPNEVITRKRKISKPKHW